MLQGVDPAIAAIRYPVTNIWFQISMQELHWPVESASTLARLPVGRERVQNATEPQDAAHVGRYSLTSAV